MSYPKNKNAQMAVEYLLVVTVVILLLLVLFYPIGKTPKPVTSFNQVGTIPRQFALDMSSAVEGVWYMANAIDYSNSK